MLIVVVITMVSSSISIAYSVTFISIATSFTIVTVIAELLHGLMTIYSYSS